jgi:hypothetical protein
MYAEVNSLAPPVSREELFAIEAAQREAGERKRTYWWIVALLCAIVFEGAFRKWLLPAAFGSVAYLSKDAIGLVFVFTHPIAPRFRVVCRTRVLFGVVGIVLLYPLLVGLTGAEAPAILRFKNAVLWPLIALHLAANMDSRTLDRITRFLAPVVIGMAVLGVFQYGSSPGAFVNRFPWQIYDSDVAITFGAMAGVRATGTFSFISGMTNFAVIVFGFLLWRLLVMKDARERKFILAGMAAAVVCGLTTGSRYIVFGMGLPTVLTLLASRNFIALMRLSLAAILVAVVLWLGAGSGFLGAFIDRWQNSADSMANRITGAGGYSADYGQILDDEPFGAGLGQASVLAHRAGIENVMYEQPISTLIVEAGYFGIIALGITALAGLSLVREGLSSRSAVFYLGVFAIAGLALYGLVNDAWHDHTGTALGWSFIGFWFSTHPTFVAAEAEAALADDALPEGAGEAIGWR